MRVDIFWLNNVYVCEAIHGLGTLASEADEPRTPCMQRAMLVLPHFITSVQGILTLSASAGSLSITQFRKSPMPREVDVPSRRTLGHSSMWCGNWARVKVLRGVEFSGMGKGPIPEPRIELYRI